MISQVHTVEEVLEGIQHAKAKATDFRTNFFPVQARIQAWVSHGELWRAARESATFFLRKDRDFWHFYFCAASPMALEREAATVAELKTERVVTDLVGRESELSDPVASLQSVGFREYARLRRLVRAGRAGESPFATGDVLADWAEESDCASLLRLIESAFDPYAEQLPTLYEVEAAVRQQQVLVVKYNREVAGSLFFETQGFASTVRFWVVAEEYRALRVGSALMSAYFNSQNTVRRFTLWVNACNTNAIQKYGHYGYAPDGLVDHVLANQTIP